MKTSNSYLVDIDDVPKDPIVDFIKTCILAYQEGGPAKDHFLIQPAYRVLCGECGKTRYTIGNKPVEIYPNPNCKQNENETEDGEGSFHCEKINIAKIPPWVDPETYCEDGEWDYGVDYDPDPDYESMYMSRSNEFFLS